MLASIPGLQSQFVTRLVILPRLFLFLLSSIFALRLRLFHFFRTLFLFSHVDSHGNATQVAYRSILTPPPPKSLEDTINSHHILSNLKLSESMLELVPKSDLRSPLHH